MTPTRRPGLRRLAAVAAAWLAALALAGCANLGNGNGAAAAPAGAASGAAPAVERAEYRLDVVAPEELRPLLLNYLDLARFQTAPATEGITSAELDRLVLAAPAQARSLLETEGYFSPQVKVQRVTGAAAAGGGPASVFSALTNRLKGGATVQVADDAPLIRVEVDPGPRVTVSSFTLDVTGALQDLALTSSASANRQIGALRRQWALQPGEAFRQSRWSSAKNATLAQLRAEGYPAANWAITAAKIDAPSNSAQLTLVIDSGPLFRLGALEIEGLERYGEDAVRMLSTFEPGMPYDDKLLLDFQERLQKAGLFEGAFVEVDPNPETATAAPVRVRVKELTLQTATFGAGFSANTGPRVTLEHTHRRVFGQPWIAKNKFELGPEQQLWQGDLTSHPLDGVYRNLIGGTAERLRSNEEVRRSWSARIGRTQDKQRIERLYYLEYVNARVTTPNEATNSNSDAWSANYHWVFRKVDSVLLPTRGTTLSAQAAGGYAHSSTASDGPFGRAYARLTGYWPLGSSWYGTARVEAGQVFADLSVGVPDTLLFRAGGDESVRGYAYRALGPVVNDVVTSGRVMATASAEIARPISASRPAFWWAVFADVGNAAEQWTDMSAAWGYGIGLRWRSPVGPLKLDLAYGQEVHAYRVHLSVGIAF